MMVAAYKKMLSRTGFIQRKRMDEEVERWIDELKIVTPSGRLPVQALSGGNQQKVVKMCIRDRSYPQELLR